MNLATEAVVLVLAGESDVFEALEDDVDSFGRLREHRLEWDTNLQVALFSQSIAVRSNFDQLLDDSAKVWALTTGLFYRELNILAELVKLCLTDLLFHVEDLLGRAHQIRWRVADSTSQG